MIRVAVAVAIALTAVAPPAHALCNHRSYVVGFDNCRRFGAWAARISFGASIGPSELRVEPRYLTGPSMILVGTAKQTATFAAGVGSAPLVAYGASLRLGPVMVLHHLYLALDGAEYEVTRGPALVEVGAPGSTSGGRVNGSRNLGVSDMGIAIGLRQRLGSFTISAELVPELRSVDVKTTTGIEPDNGMTYALDARGRLDVWLTRYVTIDASAGADLVHPGIYTFSLMAGVHAFPYDRLY